MKSRETLLIVDANHLLHRVSHVPGLIELNTEVGSKFGGVYGFLRCLKKALEERMIWRCVAVWDGGVSKRRLGILPSYKSRKYALDGAEAQETRDQFDFWRGYLEQILPMLSVSSVRIYGREGDDVIYEVREAWRRQKPGRWCGVLSEDRDFIQLVDDDTYLYMPIDNKCIEVGVLEEHAGVPKDKYLLFKCLNGDPSDSIRGIPGVGENTSREIALGAASIDSVVDFCSESKNPRAKLVAESIDIVERNMKLMQLGQEQFTPVEMQMITSMVGSVPRGDLNGARELFDLMEMTKISRGFSDFSIPFQRLSSQCRGGEVER